MHRGDKKCAVILVEKILRRDLGSEVNCVIEVMRYLLEYYKFA